MVTLYLSVSFPVVADDLVGGEVAEDLVWRGVGPDPVLVVDYLPVPEPNFLLLHLLAVLLQSNKFGFLKQCSLLGKDLLGDQLARISITHTRSPFPPSSSSSPLSFSDKHSLKISSRPSELSLAMCDTLSIRWKERVPGWL